MDSSSTPPTSKTEPGKKYYTVQEIDNALDDEENGLAIFQRMIDNGMDCNQYFGYEGTLLTRAIEADDLPVVKLLLAHGADPNCGAGLCNNHPLFFAAEEASPEVVHALVSSGASMKHSRAIHAAAESCRFDMVQTLLELGAPIEDRWPDSHSVPGRGDVGYGTPLHSAVRGSSVEKARLGSLNHLQTVRVLLEARADFRAKDSKGKTPLQVAEEGGFDRIAAYLREWELHHYNPS